MRKQEKQIRLGYSSLTETVFAGNVNKKGDMWLKKQDVTRDFICCIIDFVGANDNRIISVEGKPKYNISVKEITEENEKS